MFMQNSGERFHSLTAPCDLSGHSSKAALHADCLVSFCFLMILIAVTNLFCITGHVLEASSPGRSISWKLHLLEGLSPGRPISWKVHLLEASSPGRFSLPLPKSMMKYITVLGKEAKVCIKNCLRLFLTNVCTG